MEFVGLALGAAHVVIGVGHGISVIVEKNAAVKKRDEEIEEERKKERESEKEKEASRSLEIGVNYFKHEHPLNEIDGNDEEFVCGGCRRSGRGRRLRCEIADCDFEVHKVCASSPVMLVGDFQPEAAAAVQTLETFAHPEHIVREVYKHGEKYVCGHCKSNGDGIRYRCDECNFNLHPICAKSPTRLTSSMHPEHELDLITRPHFANCATCGHGGKTQNRVYACEPCKFYLHPSCSQWPHYLFHELHPVVHPLQLEIISSSSSSSLLPRKCNACKKKCKASLYHCENCDESFHPDCLLQFSVSGSTDGKGDRFRKEVVKHAVFHVGFIGVECCWYLLIKRSLDLDVVSQCVLCRSYVE